MSILQRLEIFISECLPSCCPRVDKYLLESCYDVKENILSMGMRVFYDYMGRYNQHYKSNV